MGNFNNQSSETQIPINFKELSRSQHPILGEVRHIINNHNETEYTLIERVFVSQPQFEKCQKKIKSRSKHGKMKQKSTQNQYIIEVVDYRSIEQNQFCGKTYKLFIFLKDFKADLKTVFQERRIKKQPYTESQLLQLSLKIINCLIQMSDLGLKPFHLSMESILIRKSIIKLIDCDLTNQMSPVDSLNFKSQLRKGTFISPEMLVHVMQCQPNTVKSDIFTLGVIILSLMTLRSLDEVYDYSTRKINFSFMDKLIHQSSFSQGFKNVLKEMLEEYPDERIGILRLKQTLTSLLASITNNNSFNFSNNNVNNNLDDSNYKFSQTTKNKGLIYLGKHPNLRNNETFNGSTLIPRTPQHQRRNSYHKLLNDKQLIARQKKSVSFTTVNNINNSSFLKEDASKPTLNHYFHYKDTPITNVQITPILEKIKQNSFNHQDVSDIKSDIPISPSTLQCKSLSLGKAKPIPYGQSWTKSNNQYNNVHFRISQRQVQNNEDFIQKKHHFEPYYQIQTNVQPWMGNQKNMIIINNQSNQISLLPQKVNVSNFSKMDLIQRLQTPRITKKIDLNNSGKKMQSKEKKVYEQTPIKSLELRTQEKQQNGLFEKPIQQIQQEKVFGRYDFSNGSVYEGEFNSQNEFQGNGTLYFLTGKIFYRGCWKSNQFHGFGILNNIQNPSQLSPNQTVEINYQNFNLNDNNLWTQYEGQFHEDKKHGFGTLYFVNGDKFSGNFVNDSIHGFGHFYLSSTNLTIMGIWVENVFRQG